VVPLALKEAFLIQELQMACLFTELVVQVPPDAFALIALHSKTTKLQGFVNASARPRCRYYGSGVPRELDPAASFGSWEC
jgi:hypothetical protein